MYLYVQKIQNRPFAARGHMIQYICQTGRQKNVPDSKTKHS